MLWICLTAWAGLFIWYFRMRKKAEDHKLVRRIFCLAATGFIAGTALCLPIGVRKVSGDEKAELQLERGALGSQPTEEKLEVSVGNQKPERITLSVPARAYSAEEIEEAFSAAIEALDEIILGENLSFHTVNRNMDLVTEIPGSPVALSWETDRPLLIDSRGLLSDEISEEGVEVTLKAELELQGETTEYRRRPVGEGASGGVEGTGAHALLQRGQLPQACCAGHSGGCGYQTAPILQSGSVLAGGSAQRDLR